MYAPTKKRKLPTHLCIVSVVWRAASTLVHNVEKMPQNVQWGKTSNLLHLRFWVLRQTPKSAADVSWCFLMRLFDDFLNIVEIDFLIHFFPFPKWVLWREKRWNVFAPGGGLVGLLRFKDCFQHFLNLTDDFFTSRLVYTWGIFGSAKSPCNLWWLGGH